MVCALDIVRTSGIKEKVMDSIIGVTIMVLCFVILYYVFRKKLKQKKAESFYYDSYISILGIQKI